MAHSNSEYVNTRLALRLAAAAVFLRPVNSKYRVIFDDPHDPDAPVKVLIPAPEWMAAALHGGVLPSVEAYIRDAARYRDFCAVNDPASFSWVAVGGAEHWTADPIGPMTEEEAIQYLIVKDIPEHIRTTQTNRPHYFVVPREAVSSDRTFRNAWELDEGYVRVDMTKARTIHRAKLVALEEERQEEVRKKTLRDKIRIFRLDDAMTPEDLKRVVLEEAAYGG